MKVVRRGLRPVLQPVGHALRMRLQRLVGTQVAHAGRAFAQGDAGHAEGISRGRYFGLALMIF
jgi:hypothetical protein